jgi:PBP1b-binding outer membrane lipoprotein LpoB
MKHLIPVVIALAAFVLVGCDKQKSAIDDNKEATKNAIDNRKDAVDAQALRKFAPKTCRSEPMALRSVEASLSSLS